MEHKIRLGDTLDLYDVAHIEKQCFNIGSENRNKPLFIALKQKKIYVYVIGYEIAGYIWIDTNLKKNTSYILELAILPAFRKKGCAKKLVEYAIDILKSRNIISCRLHVYVMNKCAINLYKNLGFEKIDYIINHYGFYNSKQSLDAYLMEIILNAKH